MYAETSRESVNLLWKHAKEDCPFFNRGMSDLAEQTTLQELDVELLFSCREGKSREPRQPLTGATTKFTCVDDQTSQKMQIQ
jgi:hypothetical protein